MRGFYTFQKLMTSCTLTRVSTAGKMTVTTGTLKPQVVVGFAVAPDPQSMHESSISDLEAEVVRLQDTPMSAAGYSRLRRLIALSV